MCDEAYYDRVRNELARQYLVMRPLMEVNVRTATNLQENTFEKPATHDRLARYWRNGRRI